MQKTAENKNTAKSTVVNIMWGLIFYNIYSSNDLDRLDSNQFHCVDLIQASQELISHK